MCACIIIIIIIIIKKKKKIAAIVLPSLVPRPHPLMWKRGLVTFDALVLTPSRSRNRDLQSDRRAANQIARVSGLRPIRAAHATKTRPASG